MFKKMFLLIGIVLSILSCKKNTTQIVSEISSKKIVIICQNMPSEFLLIEGKNVKVKNSFSYTSLNNPTKINLIDIKKTSDTLIFEETNQIILNYSGLQNEYNFFARTNDTLKIKFNEQNIPYVEKNGLKNNETVNFDVSKNITYPVSDILFYLKYKKFRNTLETKEYLKESILSFDNELKLIDSLIKVKPNNDFADRRKICFYKKQAFILNEKKRLTSNNINFKKTKEVYDVTSLKYNSYKWYLKSLIKNKYNLKLVKNGQGSIVDPKTAYDSVNNDKFIPEKIKEYLLHNYLLEIAENFPKKVFEKYKSDFSKTIDNKELITDINRRFVASSNSSQEISFIDSKNLGLNLESIKNQNKGKLIYLDFWASWCAPCRKVMPDSKKLTKDYENKDVVFIYISIDKDLDKWLKANKNEKLDNTYSYLATNYPENNFYKDLDLSSIPRYLIFDKQGVLIHKNAPGPDTKEIRELLNKYLSK